MLALPPHCKLCRDVPQILVPRLRDAGEDEEQCSNASRCRKPDDAVREERSLDNWEDEVGDESSGSCKGDGEAGEQAAQLSGEELGGVEQRHRAEAGGGSQQVGGEAEDCQPAGAGYCDKELLVPSLAVEVEAEEAEADGHGEGGRGKQLLARVNLHQGQKEAGTNQLEKPDDDIGKVAVHMAACPLEHLVCIDIHGGDASEEYEDDEEVEDEEGGEVLLVGA